MAIEWLCTGKSEHLYQYTDADGALQTSAVLAFDFKAEINAGVEAGSVNELYETKPVLTEAGVEAFIGLQVYPQGFTVYMDERLTNISAEGVINIGTQTIDGTGIYTTTVGSVLILTDIDDGSGDDSGDGGDSGDIA